MYSIYFSTNQLAVTSTVSKFKEKIVFPIYIYILTLIWAVQIFLDIYDMIFNIFLAKDATFER